MIQMFEILTDPIPLGIFSLLVAAAATLVVRWVARKYNFVAKPKSDRWHKRPTAMLGGIAIFATTLVLSAFFVPATNDSLIVLAGSSFLFFVGLIDDLFNIKPYQKLAGQLIGAIVVVSLGLKLPLTGYELVDIFLTVIWIIAITNAINLLDNMDGLAAGISIIAASFLAISFGANGQIAEAQFMAVLIGALLGFLIFNFNPASIFMGDCGSMFVGFFLACAVLLNQTGGRSRGLLPILAVPVLILFVPIFDTTFVTVLRKLWGRKASQGGRDHTSHRLVALGMSERKAVLMLYAFAVCAGLLSMMVTVLSVLESLALIVFFTIVLAIIGVYLSKVKVYDDNQEEQAFRDNAMFAFLVDVSHKRRIFEMFLDVFLITLAYYASYILLFGPIENTANWNLFLESLPILIIVKIFAFLAAGVYRGLWRYTSIGDLVTFAKGTLLGSVLSVISILLIYRFQNYSRAVFVLDGIILLCALVGSRMTFRLLRSLIPSKTTGEGHNVLIYGAGDGGEMVLRELKNNPDWNRIPVGFIDDDPLKKGKVIHGLQVFDANGTLASVCSSKNVAEILISIREFSPAKLEAVKELCRRSDIELRRAEIKIEPVDID
jgi:UDP-GlcNAc:undecaprenyl-phosphate GlcNAc-1-phosphate transferase